MNNCYCTCFNANTVNDYSLSWQDFFKRKNTFALIDNLNKDVLFTFGEAFIYNEASLRKDLNFPYNVSKMHFWNSIGNRNIIWFYAYLRMLNFFKQNQNFDYYWFFDDDVTCNDWDGLFNDSKYDSDFLSFFCFKKDDVKSQPLVPYIDDSTYSRQGWFNRFPGNQDTLPSDLKEYFGSFFPVVRFSNKALKVLLQTNDANLYGYGEGFTPSILNYNNLVLDTLYLPDNTSRHFDINKINILHKNQTITWQWI